VPSAPSRATICETERQIHSIDHGGGSGGFVLVQGIEYVFGSRGVSEMSVLWLGVYTELVVLNGMGDSGL